MWKSYTFDQHVLTRQKKKRMGGGGGLLSLSDSANKTERCCHCIGVAPLMCLPCRLRLPLPSTDKTQLISRDTRQAALERTLFRQRRKSRHDSAGGSASAGCHPPHAPTQGTAHAAIFQTILIFCLLCLWNSQVSPSHSWCFLLYTWCITLFWNTPAFVCPCKNSEVVVRQNRTINECGKAQRARRVGTPGSRVMAMCA